MNLCKLKVDEKVFYLFVNIDKDNTSIQLINHDTCYTSKVQKTELQKIAIDLEMEWEKFYTLFLEALQLKPSSNNFSFSISHENNTDKLVWKQILDGGLKFQLGCFGLGKSNNILEEALLVLESVTAQLKSLRNENEQLRSDNKSMENMQKEITERLKGYAEHKNNIENILFSKFSLVLNEKKKKIQQLQESLNSSPKKAKTVNKASSDKSDVDFDSDEELTDEDDDNNDAIVTEELEEEETKTSGSRLKTTDIILDEDVAEDNDKPKKMRKKLKAKRPKTPNTIIPRTTSLPRPKRQFSSGSSDSGGGSEKRRLVQEITEDDLLAEL